VEPTGVSFFTGNSSHLQPVSMKTHAHISVGGGSSARSKSNTSVAATSGATSEVSYAALRIR
jgi:hypothetical protein